MNFWNKAADHNHLDQQKRIKSACNKKMTPVEIKDSVGYFAGSSEDDYRTTLETCTCIDFAKRKLPCKHMYRLAHELGCFDLSQYGKVGYGALARDATYNVDDILARLSKDDALRLRDIVSRIHWGDTGRELVRDMDEDMSAFIELELLREVPMPLVLPEVAAGLWLKIDLKNKLDDAGIQYPPNAKKPELVSLVAENFAKEVVAIYYSGRPEQRLYKLNPLFEGLWSKIWHRLTVLYPSVEKAEAITIKMSWDDTISKL